jgi:hypothetical protein
MPRSVPPLLTSYKTTTAAAENPRSSAALSQTLNPSLFSSLQSCLSPEFIGGAVIQTTSSSKKGSGRSALPYLSSQEKESRREARSRENRSVPFSPDIAGNREALLTAITNQPRWASHPHQGDLARTWTSFQHRLVVCSMGSCCSQISSPRRSSSELSPVTLSWWRQHH